jgi:hypothetical protein
MGISSYLFRGLKARVVLLTQHENTTMIETIISVEGCDEYL